MDRPFESDGEAAPPQYEAESSVACSSDEHEQQRSLQYHRQDLNQDQQHCSQLHHHNPQPEPESLTVLMRGLRDLAARHHRAGAGASQRVVASRLHAAAIILQVCSLACVQLQLSAAYTSFAVCLAGAHGPFCRSQCAQQDPRESECPVSE